MTEEKQEAPKPCLSDVIDPVKFKAYMDGDLPTKEELIWRCKLLRALAAGKVDADGKPWADPSA
jgi:hypothetical protein